MNSAAAPPKTKLFFCAKAPNNQYFIENMRFLWYYFFKHKRVEPDTVLKRPLFAVTASKSLARDSIASFFLVPTKIWHFKTAKHRGSFSFQIVGCFFDASILSVLQGEKRPRMRKIKLLGRIGLILLYLKINLTINHLFSNHIPGVFRQINFASRFKKACVRR